MEDSSVPAPGGRLPYKPPAVLTAADDPALRYRAGRDLGREESASGDGIINSPDVMKILKNQTGDGCWRYPGPTRENGENYDILETYRILRVLVEKYGFDRTHPSLEKAAGYLLMFQSPEGDIRGIFASQYMPHYSAGILELLIKAGYGEDKHIRRGLEWYLDNQQNEGGWAWPIRTAGVTYEDAVTRKEPVQPDPSKPFSHALTGIILRAFAAHPDYHRHGDILRAAELQKSRFFKPDRYPDRRAAGYWVKFQFPFWWTDLLTSLDTLSYLGFSAGDPDIAGGLTWFIEHQEETGLWPTGYENGSEARNGKLWVALAIYRMLMRYHVI